MIALLPLGPNSGLDTIAATRKLDDTKNHAALATIERNAKALCRFELMICWQYGLLLQRQLSL